ncbi:MAG: iron-sulfur cluster insertion protein ErpA [Halobacteriota archaeon]
MSTEAEGRLLSITQEGAEKARDLMESQDLEGYGVRIYVKQGGCSGYSYGMQFDDEVDDTDHVVEHRGVRLIVDEHSAEYIEGSTVDYVETLESTGFDVQNPNAESTCGCGESFKV